MATPITQEQIAQKSSEIAQAAQEKYASLKAYHQSGQAEVDRQAAIAETSDSSWHSGVVQAASSLAQFGNNLKNDSDASAKEALALHLYNQANPGSLAAQRLSAAYDAAVDDQGQKQSLGAAVQGVGDTAALMKSNIANARTPMEKLSALYDDSSALVGGVVHQLPNSFVAMGAMGAGALAGTLTAGPGIGTAAGMVAGATLGNMAVGQSEANQNLMTKQDVNQNDVAAMEQFFQQNRGQLLQDNAIKSGIIGITDVATLGATGAFMNAPLKAATGRALTAAGVDLTDDVAVKAAMKTPTIRQAILQDAEYIASKQGNKVQTAGLLAADMASEGVGEFVGQGVATDDWRAKDALLEAVSSFGQSGGQHLFQKGVQALQEGALKTQNRSQEKPTTQEQEEQAAPQSTEQADTEAAVKQQSSDRVSAVAQSGDIAGALDATSPLTPEEAITGLHQRVIDAKSVTDTGTATYTDEQIQERYDSAIAGADTLVAAANREVTNLNKTLNKDELAKSITAIKSLIASKGTDETSSVESQALKLRESQLASLTGSDSKNYIAQQEALLTKAKTDLESLKTTSDQINAEVTPEKSVDAMVEALKYGEPEAVTKAATNIISLAMRGRLTKAAAAAALEQGQQDIHMFSDTEKVFLRMALNSRNKGKTAEDVSNEIYDGSDDHMGMKQHWEAINDPTASPKDKADNIAQYAKFVGGQEAKLDAIEKANEQRKDKEKITLVREKDSQDWKQYAPGELIDGIEAQKIPGAYTVGDNTFQVNKATGISPHGRIQQEVTDLKGMLAHVTGTPTQVNTSEAAPTVSTTTKVVPSTQPAVKPTVIVNTAGNANTTGSNTSNTAKTPVGASIKVNLKIDTKSPTTNEKNKANNAISALATHIIGEEAKGKKSVSAAITTKWREHATKGSLDIVNATAYSKNDLIFLNVNKEFNHKNITDSVNAGIKAGARFMTFAPNLRDSAYEGTTDPQAGEKEATKLLKENNYTESEITKDGVQYSVWTAKGDIYNSTTNTDTNTEDTGNTLTDNNSTYDDLNDEDKAAYAAMTAADAAGNNTESITSTTPPTDIDLKISALQQEHSDALQALKHESDNDQLDPTTTYKEARAKLEADLEANIADVHAKSSELTSLIEGRKYNQTDNAEADKRIQDRTSGTLIQKLGSSVLTRAKDVIASIKNKAALIKLNKNQDVTEQQEEAFKHFRQMSHDISSSILEAYKSLGLATQDGNIIPTLKGKFATAAEVRDRFRNLINVDSDGNLSMDDNLASAIAAALHSQVVSLESRALTAKGINRMIGRANDKEDVSLALWKLFPEPAMTKNMLADELGRNVINLLAIKETANTPASILPELATSIGARIIAAGEARGYFHTFEYSEFDINSAADSAHYQKSLASSIAQDQEKKHFFVRLAQGDAVKGKTRLSDKVSDLVIKDRESKRFISKLFDNVRKEDKVYLEEVDEQSNINEVPKLIKEGFEAENKTGMSFDPTLLNTYMMFNEEDMQRIAGDTALYTSEGKPTVSATLMPGAEAAQKSRLQSIQNLVAFIKEQPSLEKLRVFLTSEMYVQQRSGIVGSTINPQGDKNTRWLISHESWKTEIKLDDPDSIKMQVFEQFVAESLGFKTADTFYAKQATFQPAIDALSYMLEQGDKGTLTADDQVLVVQAVQAANTGSHAFAGLMALAQRQHAQKMGHGSFTTTITTESDGKNNGLAIASNQMGASVSVEESIAFNKQFGIYTIEDAVTHFDDYKEKKGGRDLYMNTVAKAVEKVIRSLEKGISLVDFNKPRTIPKEQVIPALAAIEVLMGSVRKSDAENNLTDEPSDSLREVVKEPILMLGFGAALSTAGSKISQDFLTLIHEHISKVYSSGLIDETNQEKYNDQTRLDIINALNVLLSFDKNKGKNRPIPQNTSGLKLMGYMQGEFEIIPDTNPLFSEGVNTAISNTHAIVLGNQIKAALEDTFETLLTRTKTINTVTRIMGEVADLFYTYQVAEASRSGTLKFVHDQSSADPTSIPMAYMGILNGDADQSSTRRPLEGVANKNLNKIRNRLVKLGVIPMVATASSDIENRDTYILAMEAKRVADTNRDNQINVRTGLEDQLSNLYSSMSMQYGSMYVAIISRLTHSFDSAVMYKALEYAREDGIVALNIFDASVSGIEGLPDMTRYLNRAFFELMVSYSPTQAIVDTLERQIIGISKLDVGDVHYDIQAIIKEHTGEDFNEHWSNLSDVLETIQAQAKEVDLIKIKTFQASYSVNQYSRAGAEHVITDENLATLEAKLKEIETPRSTSELDKALARNKKTDARSRLKFTIQEVNSFDHGALKEALSAEPNADYKIEILKTISDLIPQDLKIKYISKSEAATRGFPNSIGHYESDGVGNKTIYIIDPEGKQKESIASILLHELLHATLSDVVATLTNEDGTLDESASLGDATLTANAKASIKNLFALMDKVKDPLKAEYSNAFENLHEFIAYGIENTKFQRDVLRKTEGIKTQTSTLWGGIFNRFVESLLGLLGVKNPRSAKGLGTFITEVSSLINVSKELQAKNIKLAQAAQILNMKAEAVTNFSTAETLNALTSNTTDTVFNIHLQSILNSVVTKLHGPFGVIKSAIKSKKLDAAGAWKRNATDNLTPLSKELVKSGLSVDSKQAFVMEQVYASVAAFGKGNELHTFQAYRDLRSLYESVRSALKPTDFLGSAFGTTSIKEATHLYNTIFKATVNTEGKSDYLARFAAIGLTNPGLHALLDKHVIDKTSKGKQSWAKKLQSIFESILDVIHGWTSTHESNLSNQRLDSLINKLVDIELANQDVINRQRKAETAPVRNFESRLDKLAKATGNVVIAGMDSHFVQSNRFVLVRAIAGLVKKHVSHKQQEYLSMMLTLLNDPKKGSKLGVVAGLINNVKGHDQFIELLRLGRDLLDKNRKTMIDSTTSNVLGAFINGGKNLTPAMKNAITAVVLKSNMSALLKGYSLQEIQEILSDPSKLEEHITAQASELKTALSTNADTYNQMLTNAEGLGYYSATGEVKVKVLKRNVYQIIHSFGEANNKLTQTKLNEIEPMVSKLATLFTLRHTPEADRTVVSEVMKIEAARPNEEVNGMEYALLMHANLAHNELTNIYDNDPSKAPFGNIHEKYNPFTKIRVGDEKEGIRLMDLGYEQVGKLPRDPDDADQSDRHYYVQRDMKPATQVSGIIQMGSNTSTEVRVTTGEQNLYTPEGRIEAETRAHIKKKRSDTKAALYTKPFNPNIPESYMAPEYNSDGVITNWVYLMNENMKNSVLERRNSFDAVLGTLAGSLLGKQSTEEHNKEAIQALADNFNASNAVERKKMIEVGPKSEDAELRSFWYRLPEKTKVAAKDIFGNEHIMVNNQTLDMVFGYRKVSMAAPFERANNERAHRLEAGQSDSISDLKSINTIQKLVISFVEEALEMSAKARGKSPEEAKRFAKRAAMYVTRAEAGWQEIVSDMKDKIVVVSGTVLLGNIFSNVSRLMLEGIPLKNMAHYFSVAFKGATQYLNDKKHLDALMIKSELGLATKEDMRHITQLQDAIKRNPVTPLIEAGLLPTIVEDLDADAEFGFRTQIEKQVDRLSAGIPAPALVALKGVLMTRESGAYKALAHITQLSDFVARYAMYQHQINKTNPMTHTNAVARANNAFVQYSVPMQRTMQYSDDMGFTLFTKYFLYIQKELVRISKEQPGRVMTMLLFNQLVHLGPMITDSSLIHHAGYNPLRDGVFGYWDALYKRMTIGLLV